MKWLGNACQNDLYNPKNYIFHDFKYLVYQIDLIY